MADKENLTSITIHQTANLFVNAGIVGLYHFLRRFQMENDGAFPSLSYRLDRDRLEVSCDRLLSLLEEVYYFMGRVVYDTPTAKQLKENANIYYIEEEDRFGHFPKMNTYGLTHSEWQVLPSQEKEMTN